jgi:hypothetical protein
MSLLGGGTVARFIAEMSFDWVETASGYPCSAIDGLAGGQDGCPSIGYSESCSQEPRKRILFAQLPFGQALGPSHPLVGFLFHCSPDPKFRPQLSPCSSRLFQ